MTGKELMLAMLDEDARLYAPRLFALYGVYRSAEDDDDEPGFLGWGMEFASLHMAVLCSLDGATWHSESAADLLRTHDLIAEARLIWLDERPGGNSAGDYDLAAGD